MNYLIDTHILLWWIFNDPKLDRARDLYTQLGAAKDLENLETAFNPNEG
jgi:PIN domain nuclease of toxin-antitoxin system